MQATYQEGFFGLIKRMVVERNGTSVNIPMRRSGRHLTAIVSERKARKLGLSLQQLCDAVESGLPSGWGSFGCRSRWEREPNMTILAQDCAASGRPDEL